MFAKTITRFHIQDATCSVLLIVSMVNICFSIMQTLINLHNTKFELGSVYGASWTLSYWAQPFTLTIFVLVPIMWIYYSPNRSREEDSEALHLQLTLRFVHLRRVRFTACMNACCAVIVSFSSIISACIGIDSRITWGLSDFQVLAGGIGAVLISIISSVYAVLLIKTGKSA